VNAKIYIEGGGEGELLDTYFRQGWRQFFEAAGLSGKMPRIVRGRGRERTFGLFVTAVKNRKTNELPLMLLDSENPLQHGHSVWQHLKARDKWDRPDGASDDQAFLMVQVMETWFLADRGMLVSYFGSRFRQGHLRNWPSLEDISKADVFEVLEKSTAACVQKPYKKGKVSFEMLARLDPIMVENACPHAKDLLDHLRKL
jgi:hypothetical protein